ncbi:MAG: bacteriophage abortive infection AbiH family protein [Flavobacteriaceae bacterium]
MNIVYLIGNGFDINLNLKTRYPEFYSEFTKQEFETKGTELLKSEIKENTKDWSDFEKKFGDFTSIFKEDTNEFNKTYKDVVISLSNYLLKVEKTFKPKEIDKDKFIDDIINPEKNLLPLDERQIKTFKKKWDKNPITINFITYNYTKTIEKILGKNSNIDLGLTRQQKRILIADIKHVHGYLNKRMIIGVNDKSQISNEIFKEQDEVTYNLIKSVSNEISKELVMEDCINKIKGAQLICIFGSSIGSTDLMWWQLIIEKLKTDCLLVIFHRGPDTNPLLPSENAILENKVKNDFFEMAKISASERKALEKKVIVAVNSEMFNILKNNYS